MKILSISDVITNSSSEVFTYYTEDSIKEIKRLVDAILKAGGSDKTCDDLFEINLTYDEEALQEVLEESEEELENLTKEQKLRIALEYDDGLSVGDRQCIDGFEVIAKDPKNEIVASFIADIPFIFDTEAFYNY